jgi:hypothetical protein
VPDNTMTALVALLNPSAPGASVYAIPSYADTREETAAVL